MTAKWKEGDLCKCKRSKLQKREVSRKPKPNATFRYAWKLVCISCNRIYLNEEAKVPIDQNEDYRTNKDLLRELITDAKAIAARLEKLSEAIDVYENKIKEERKDD